MTQVEKLSIFLASPSDVERERKYVHEVINEINKTVASSLGVLLDTVDSSRAFPSFGEKDGQAVINEQIGEMEKYELFVAIFWNRIGTATPRDISGTVEEFTRAFKALQRKKKPQIWLYFCNAPFAPKTQEDLDQKSGVISFRNKLRSKGLWREYQNPRDFVTQFRMHINTWLHERSAKPATLRKTKAEKIPVDETQTTQLRKTGRTRAADKGTAAKATTTRRRATGSPASNRSAGIVKSPGSWVMLNDRFFRSHPTVRQTDRSIVLHIAPDALEDADEVMALQPGDFRGRTQVTYADLHEAALTSVQSVASESRSGKTIFTVTLSPFSSSHGGGSTEFSYSNYSADDIATLRAHWILLGEPLPKQIEHLASSYQQRNSITATGASVDTLPRLWATLRTDTRWFLPKAWLYVVYLLKTGNIVESVQALELGPIKEHSMHVKFRGRRRKIYANQDPFTITVEGECRLEV